MHNYCDIYAEQSNTVYFLFQWRLQTLNKNFTEPNLLYKVVLPALPIITVAKHLPF